MITNDIDQVLQQMRVLAAQSQGNMNAPVTAQPGTHDRSFAEMMQDAIDQVNLSQKQAKDLATALEQGNPDVDIAEVMVAAQKSGIAFQALTEVRNKLLTAYQDVMNMPV